MGGNGARKHTPMIQVLLSGLPKIDPLKKRRPHRLASCRHGFCSPPNNPLPQKKFTCASVPAKDRNRGTHIKLFWEDSGDKARGLKWLFLRRVFGQAFCSQKSFREMTLNYAKLRQARPNSLRTKKTL